MPITYPRIITGRDVRLAVQDTLRRGVRTFLDEVGSDTGRIAGALPVFRSYVSSFDTDKFEEDQVPACVIVAPGLIGSPTHRGSGQHEATWSVAVASVVSGQDRENTFELVELYAAATRAVLIHERSLGGVAVSTDWLNERYDELDFDDVRTIAAGIVQFAVTVETAIDDHGPLTDILVADATTQGIE